MIKQHQQMMMDHPSANVLALAERKKAEQAIILRMRTEARQAARYQELIVDEQEHMPKMKVRP